MMPLLMSKLAQSIGVYNKLIKHHFLMVFKLCLKTQYFSYRVKPVYLHISSI